MRTAWKTYIRSETASYIESQVVCNKSRRDANSSHTGPYHQNYSSLEVKLRGRRPNRIQQAKIWSKTLQGYRLKFKWQEPKERTLARITPSYSSPPLSICCKMDNNNSDQKTSRRSLSTTTTIITICKGRDKSRKAAPDAIQVHF